MNTDAQPAVCTEEQFLSAFAISRETLLTWISQGGVSLHHADGLIQFRNVPKPVVSPYLTAREAASYLRISYSTFRKKATKIRRHPGTRRYRREDLDEFATSLRPKRKR